MKDQQSDLKPCVGITAEGKPCSKAATYGDTCYSHCQLEEIKQKRHKVAVIAGSHLTKLPKNKGMKINDSRDLHKYLALVLTHMSTGRIKLTTHHLRDIANLSKVFMETETKSNLLARIERIEKDKAS